MNNSPSTSKLLEIFQKRFLNFGTNKSREIFRLINEISKIEKIPFTTILNLLETTNYQTLKNTLLQRRYPKTFHRNSLNSYYLPKYEIDPSKKADFSPKKFYPKNIYYEQEAIKSELFEKIKILFKNSNFKEIGSLKAFMKENIFTLKDYNNRCNNLFLVKEKYDFFKKCPCSQNVVNCGYSIMNLGMGCIYECSYCFLQGYQNVQGIVVPYNIDDYLVDNKIVASTKGFFNYKRIGSGEFTDSLIFDDITNFSQKIVEYFKPNKDIYFEFKTKSTNIHNLLFCGGAGNIVVAWSVNTKKITDENEFKTPSIQERLLAAKKCALAGFSTAFHFDPVIYYDNWKQDYKDTIDMIFDIVPNTSIKWISIGTLRMPCIQKTVIENRFPQTDILNGELLLGKDFKLRYDDNLRIEIYKHLSKYIKSKKSKTIIYLCMEDNNIWKAVFNS
jgi:spore photoproduct lyase